MSDLYRPCVGIILLNNNKDRVFIARRIDTVINGWQMPQGGVDAGEDIVQAARREMFEEIGILSRKILHILPKKYTYDLPEYLRTKLWGGKYRGQEQNWIIAQHVGSDKEINLLAHTKAEFCAWRWCQIDELPSIAIDFKRDIYNDLVLQIKSVLG